MIRVIREAAASARRAGSTGLARETAATYATRIALAVISLATAIVVARALGPEGRGAYALTLALAAVATALGHVGLHVANTYYVSREREADGVLLGNTLAAVLTLGLGGSALVGALFLIWPEIAPVTGALLALALARVAPALGWFLIRSLMMGTGDVRGFNLTALLPELAGFVALLAIAIAGTDDPALLFAPACGASVLGFAWALWRLSRSLVSRIGVSWSTFVKTARYGMRAWLAGLGVFLILRSDLFVLGYLEGDGAVGLYSVAAAIATAMLLLPISISQVLFPRLSAQQDDSSRIDATRRSIRGMLIVLVPISVVVIAFAAPAITLAFGEDFADAASATRILALGVIPLAITLVAVQLQAARGLPWPVAWIWGGALALNVGLNLILIDPLGIDGAALASLISYSAAASAQLATVVRGS